MSGPAQELPAVGDLMLRPVAGRDRPFLLALYAATRADEMRATGWPEARRRAFLASQFHAQQRHYAQALPGSQHRIVEREGEAIGQLRWRWTQDELRLIDVALVPAWRGRGLGAQLVLALCAQAHRKSMPITLHVEVGNTAYALYRRLGFEIVETDGLRLRMRAAACNTRAR